MYDVERDIFEKKADRNDLIYKTITGLDTDSNVQTAPKLLQQESGVYRYCLIKPVIDEAYKCPLDRNFYRMP